MKQYKITKIFTFIVAAALTMGIAFAFSAGAETAADSDLAIAGKNIVYGDTLTIRYAVPTSKISANAKLVIESEDKSASVGYYATQTTDKITGAEDTYYIFEVTGIPASAVCKEIVVHIEDGEKVGPELKYSLAEYFYERLYADGVINATDGKEAYQKKLYLSYLEYAANAQDLFNNYEDGLGETLVTDRHYVNIAGGAAGVYEPGYELTLGETATLPGWRVTTYTLNDDGTATPTTAYKAVGSKITLAEGTIATLIEEGKYVGEYFAQYGGLNYDSISSTGGLAGYVDKDVNGYTAYGNTAGSRGQQMNLVTLSTEGEVNKALCFSRLTNSGPKLNNYEGAFISLTDDTNVSGNCFVFETDIMIASRAAVSDWFFNFRLAYVPSAGRPTSSNPVTGRGDLAYLYLEEDENGVVNGYIGNSANHKSPAITLDTWHNIRIEMGLDGKAYWYVDGEFYMWKTMVDGGFGVTDFKDYANRVVVQFREGGTTNSSLYFDNTFVGIVSKQ